MIISRTPFRVSLLGGGTDYPSWSRNHGGVVVGGAINKFSFVTARHLPPFHPYRHRIAYREVETVNGFKDIRHAAVRACVEYLGLDETSGLEISHLADLPGRSGVGSSSSFVVGLMNALLALQGKRMTPSELATAATHIEQDLLGDTVGCQDQVFAAHGNLNVIKFLQSGEARVYPLFLTPDQVTDLERHLLLFFTGVSRTSSEVASGYATTLVEREKEQWAMMRLAERGADFVQRCKWEQLGELIDQSWRIKSALPGVSTPDIAGWYNLARVSGAWGGKLTGAGGGGCMLLATPPEKRGKIVEAMTGVGMTHVPFRFECDGSSIIYAERGQ